MVIPNKIRVSLRLHNVQDKDPGQSYKFGLENMTLLYVYFKVCLRLDGPFNPLTLHLHKRVWRTHLALMDFLLSVAPAHKTGCRFGMRSPF